MKKITIIMSACMLFASLAPALHAQTAPATDTKPIIDEPAAKPKKPAMKPKMAKPAAVKKPKTPASVTVKITNARAVAVSDLNITLSATTDAAASLKKPLAAGKSISVKISTKKGCTFDVRGSFEDEAAIEADSVDFCADASLVLKD